MPVSLPIAEPDIQHISAVIDQEGWREVQVPFTFSRWIEVVDAPDKKQSKWARNICYMAEFVTEPTPLPFNAGALQAAPVLRKLQVTSDDGITDLLTRQASLGIRTDGLRVAKGKEGRGGSWVLEFEVQDRLTMLGRTRVGEKVRICKALLSLALM